MEIENTPFMYALRPGLQRSARSLANHSYIAHLKGTGTLDVDSLTAAVAAAAGADVNYIRYLESVRRQELVKALRAGKKVYLDGIAITATIRGRFDTVDGEFDAERNQLVVTAYTYDPLHDCLQDIVPQNAVTGGNPTLSRIRETGQKVDETLVTGREVTVTGRDLSPSMTAADEGVKLVNAKTGETVAVAQLVSSNLAEVVCSFATLPAAGRYLLVVSTRAGFDAEYRVVSVSREITVK